MFFVYFSLFLLLTIFILVLNMRLIRIQLTLNRLTLTPPSSPSLNVTGQNNLRKRGGNE